MGIHTDIAGLVDRLYENDSVSHKEELSRYLERLHGNHSEALSSMRRTTIALLLTWAAGNAMARGVVSEAQVAGFRVPGITNLLPAFPLVLGFLAYELACAYSAAAVLETTLSRCYKHCLPS